MRDGEHSETFERDQDNQRSKSKPIVPGVPGGNDSGGLAAFLAEADRSESEPLQLAPVVWSDDQNDIYDFATNGQGHGVVDGVAGCGKTRTNVHVLSLLDPNLKIKYAAFNKHIEIDISKKAPSYVDVSTLHKWGKNNIEAAWPKAKFTKFKVYDIIDKYKFAKDDFPLKQNIAKLVGLLKGDLIEPTDKNIQRLLDDFCVDIEPEDIGFVRRTFNASVANMNKFDLDDMIYFPAIKPEICQKFAYIVIDEYQDLNWAQSKLTTNSLAPDGRMLGVGDPNQSMYQFRGAGIGIMDRMAKILNATRLPLSISYRAPLTIVGLVNDKYPHINFEAAPNAIPGSIEHIDYDKFYNTVDENHGVLCRTNAPLVPRCFALIRRGIKATILGRDIGKNLLGLINKRAKLKRTKTLDNLLSEIKIYHNDQTVLYEHDKMVSRAALLDDQCKTIYALATECNTIDDLKNKTKTVFSADRQGVTFSTIHKAKGLEWDTVHILEPKLMPHPMAKSSRDRAQEVNIAYVADTRTKDKLYYVQED